MDFSSFKTSDWLMVGGGAAMLILGILLPWTTVSGDISESGDGPFQYFFTGGLAWLLVVAVGILAMLKTQGRLQATPPWDLLFVIMSGVATLLMLLRVVLGPYDEPLNSLFDIELGRGIGMIGALVWSGITFAGASMAFRASGGELKDLTDVHKLKDQFGNDRLPPPSG